MQRGKIAMNVAMNEGSRYIFVTGGVTSSLGKGIAASSIACLLESQGYKVSLQKMDPYINIDPGTMSPYQHGEVYVTSDGAETDLDIGNYERFTSEVELLKINSVTTGQIYLSVIERERRGEYSGQTVQVIPHITDEIKLRIKNVSKASKADFVIVEIGGTVGDIESIPFLEAIRQLSHELGSKGSLFIHLTLIPLIASAGEYKTKPTQHSVKELRSLGIRPDILLCRVSKGMSHEMKEKISLFCDVDYAAVIQALDITTTIYEVPLLYSQERLDKVILDKFGMEWREGDLREWKELVNRTKSPKHEVTIAVVGKYIDLQDAYKSLYAAIQHGGMSNNSAVKIKRVHSEELRDDIVDGTFKGVDGIIIASGFGERGIEGKLLACTYGREHGVPTFGICLGMQCMVIEYAQEVCKLSGANSTEFDKATKYPVISLLEEQHKVCDLGGTMRLGDYEARLIDEDSKVYKAYKGAYIKERHRHRYEVSNKYRDILEDYGLKVVGLHESKDLVEVVEIKSHAWYIGVQYHPEFKSKLKSVHPLFRSFVCATIRYKEGLLVGREQG